MILVNVTNVSLVTNNKGIIETWYMVRDTAVTMPLMNEVYNYNEPIQNIFPLQTLLVSSFQNLQSHCLHLLYFEYFNQYKHNNKAWNSADVMG